MLTCPNCGMDYEYFQKNGKLGCDNCYNVFRDQVKKIIDSVQKGTIHMGKKPNVDNVKSNTFRHLSRLKISLDEAIRKEEYEKAAIIRDKIKRIESELTE